MTGPGKAEYVGRLLAVLSASSRSLMRFVTALLLAWMAAIVPGFAQPHAERALCSLSKEQATEFYGLLVEHWLKDAAHISRAGISRMVVRQGPVLTVRAEEERSFTDNTDICWWHSWSAEGRWHSFHKHIENSDVVLVSFGAKETNGLFLVRMADGDMVKVDGGFQAMESPDGSWVAVLEAGMGLPDAISVWNVRSKSIHLAGRIFSVHEASFASSTRLDARKRGEFGPVSVSIELRDGTWVETSPAPK